jgi:hypothetical protein
MNLLQPFMLWGTLAVAIPVIIHFWHQKKGKELDWAAMQWLIDKSQQQSRGLRLDDLPLLVVRCLLILLLVFLLSQPVISWFRQMDHTERVHLVEPSAYLVDDFRFELETALKKGEKIYWINPTGEEVKDLSSISSQKGNGALYIQEVINKVSKPGVKLDLYLVNNAKIIDLPKVYVPQPYSLHTAVDSSRNGLHQYLNLGEGRKLYVHQGNLTVSGAGESGDFPRLASEPVHSGKLKVLVSYQNLAEQQTVEAALGSLSSVYSIPLDLDLKSTGKKMYDLVLTDQKVLKPSQETLYVLSGSPEAGNQISFSNVVHLQDSLRIQTSEMVDSGQLPEFLGDLLVQPKATGYAVCSGKVA